MPILQINRAAGDLKILGPQIQGLALSPLYFLGAGLPVYEN